MNSVLRRTAVLAACVLLSGLSMPLASASENRIPDPPPPPGDGPTTTYDLKDSEFALTISPTRLVIGPADIGKVSEILVVNRGQATAAVTVQKRNFTAAPDGSLNYQDDAPYGAASWVTVSPESFELATGASQIVKMSITMPAAPELGDHQVAIVFLVPSGETSGNIKVNRGVGIPTFITVPGPTDNSVSLGGLSAPGFALGGPALSAPGFSLGGPINISTSMQNVGTVHRDFRAKEPLTLDAAGDPATFPDFTVMRGAVRDISTTWTPPFMCICNPTVAIPGPDGTLQEATARVVVFPLHWLAAAIAATLAILFIIRFRRRRYAAAVENAAARQNAPVGSASG